MPRLLLITTVPVTLRAFLLPVARRFRSLGWRVEAAASGAPADPALSAAFDAVHDVGFSRRPLSPLNLARAPRALRALVAAGEYDLIHVHTPIAAFVTRLALAGRPRPPIVYTAHGFHFHSAGRKAPNMLFLALERLAARWTDWLTVMNAEDLDAARRWRLARAERTALLPGIGLPVAAYAAGDREAARGALGLGPEARAVLCAAELTPRKRHADLLAAFARLERPEAVLLLAGEGPLEGPLARQAAALGLASRVRFLGWREDMPDLLAAADCCVLLSEREGLPRTLQEAMAAGRPIVATRIRGVVDLLGPDHPGLCALGCPEAAAEALERALGNDQAIRRRAASDRERVGAFDESGVLGRLEALYARALAER